MLPTLLDPGIVADEPMPPSTGTKFRPPAQYFRGARTGQLYYRDIDGTIYALEDLGKILNRWPEEITRDGNRQMAPAHGEDARPRRSGADRARLYRQRRRSRRPDAHAGPADFAAAEKTAVA